MAAYIEVLVVGGRRGFIECGSIAGVVTSPGLDIFALPVDEKPLMVFLRGGATLEVVGESAGKIMYRADMARKELRASGKDTHVDFLNDPALDGDVPVQE